MLRAAIDHLANLDLDDDYYRRSVIYTADVTSPVTVARQVSMQPEISQGNIQLSVKLLDRALNFLRTPFPAETKQQLNYMRAVLP